MLRLVLFLLCQEAPIEVPLPSGLDPAKPFVLLGADGRERRAQVAGKSLVVLTENRAEELRVAPGGSAAHPSMDWADDAGALVASAGGRKLLRYNRVEVKQPDPLYSRSGYLHPLWSPAGRIVTNDSPPNHLHHHGIWSAWTSSEFEGRKSNFWESKEKQGRVECVKVVDIVKGPAFGGLTATHRFVNLNGPDGPRTVLNETWELRVYPFRDRTVFDLVSTQTTATDQPLLIKEYRYGGIGFRGSADWEGKTGVEYRTSEGKGRVDGHATKARWVVATGKVDGSPVSIGFLGHPSNFRAPQPLRLHPDEPFFNWAVPQGGDFAIEPGKPYVARYRFIVADGALPDDEMNAAWSAYGETPKFTLTVAK